MDSSHERGLGRGLPRPSRLPLPRTTVSTSIPGARQESGPSRSQLPRPSTNQSGRSKDSTRLHDVGRPSTSFQNGQSDRVVRHGPPSATLDQLEQLGQSGNELAKIRENVGPSDNETSATMQRYDVPKEKRKPRPSLSERTLETLSQLPPSPSPSRHRPSMLGGYSAMAPPDRPTSLVGLPGSGTAARRRSLSPLKLVRSPLNDAGTSTPDTLHLLSSEETNMYTPTKASSKAFRTNLPKPHPRIDLIDVGATRRESKGSSIPSPRLRVSNVKSMHDIRGHATKAGSSETSNLPRFGNMSKPAPNNTDATYKTKLVPTTKPPARRRPLVREASDSTPSTRVSSTLVEEGTKNDRSGTKPSPHSTLTRIPKTALSLRETMVKAKAAKIATQNETKKSHLVSENTMLLQQPESLVETTDIQTTHKTLQKRINSAVTSGVLNIAAMGLKTMPVVIQTMYDFDPDSKINWAETVDLTKLNAADNELDELPEEFFPDWSMEELQNDDGKSNQFGGLQHLDLRVNNLSKMPTGLRRLASLQTLCLNNNKLGIEVFDVVCQLPDLKELYLANNNLNGMLPFSLTKLSQLEVLDLHSNRATGLPDHINNLRKLRKLNVSDNSFEQVPILSFCEMSLSELDISKNALPGTLFPEHVTNASLQTLDVSFNKLVALANHDLDFPSIKTLICDSNQLVALPSMAKMQCLNTLRASRNRIEELPDAFTAATNLHTVDLSANCIKVLDFSIGGMHNLSRFNIAANPLREKKYLDMSTDHLKAELAKKIPDAAPCAGDDIADGHMGMSASSSDNIDKRRHKFIPKNGTLDLSSQDLTSVDFTTVDLSQPVHTLQLTNNRLTILPFDLLVHPMIRPSLQTLNLSHNPSLRLSEHTDGQVFLPALKTLSFANTSLTSITVLTENLSAPVLNELNISFNRMEGSFPHVRDSFPSLTTLLATDNRLTSIDIDAIRGLEVLDVRNNEIDYLSPFIGELGNFESAKAAPNRLRAFECSGNKFRIPRLAILEKGTDAILKDLRRMVPTDQVGIEWRE